MTRLPANNWVYIQGVGVQNWINFGKSTETGLTLFPTADLEGRQNVKNMPVVPNRRFNINSFSDRNEGHNADYNLALEQTFDSGLVADRDIARRDPATGAATFSTGLATDADVDTTSMGVTYFPIKEVGVYAFQNRGFQPALTNTPKLDGTV